MNFYTLLHLHHRIKSRRLKLLGLFFASHLGFRHLSIRLDPVLGCNLACRMCYFSSSEYRRKNQGMMDTDELEEMARVLFPRAFQLVVGCGAEPTKHKDYLELFKLAKKYNVPDVGIVTNGQLLQLEDVEVMCNNGISEITLSTHGVKRGTYEKFMTGGSHEKFLEVLQLINHIRKNRGKGPGIRINYTVNPENLEELKDFFEVYGKYGIDTLQVRPVMDIGGKYKKEISNDLLPIYNEIINSLKEECRRNNVRLLANTLDPAYTEDNKDADLAELVYTYISPKTSGQLGIQWQSSTFRKYRRSDKWTSRLMQALFHKGSSGKWMARSLKYDEIV